jgi:hypothetical protein
MVCCKLQFAGTDDILRPDKGSPEFEEFLEFLGDRIELSGWCKYKGGLQTDCKWRGDVWR